MSKHANPGYMEMIVQRGQSAGLPLFETQAAPPKEIYVAAESKAKALQAIKQSGRVQGNRFAVLEAIFAIGSATDHEVAARLGWEINRVIPRRRELQQLGLVEEAGEKKGGYGLTNTLWRVNITQLHSFAGGNGQAG